MFLQISARLMQDAKYEGRLEGRLEGIQADRAEAIIELLKELGSVPQELRDAIMREGRMDELVCYRFWQRVTTSRSSEAG